jgi:mannose-6-phosphate isomerase-like protein (cupin superfamily)
MPGQVYTGTAADLPRETRFDGQYHRTGLAMDAANVCFVWLEPHAFSAYTDENGLAPGHSHPFDMLLYVIEGKLRFWTGDHVHDLDGGDFIYIPRDVPHGGMPRDDSAVHLMEIFAPLRTDYLYIAEHQLAAGQAERQPDGSRVDSRSLFDVAAAMGDSELADRSRPRS